MPLNRHHITSVLHTMTVPLLATAVLATSAGFAVPGPVHPTAVAEPVELTASIDTDRKSVV